ncbi:group III truncated hemoglobin [Stappia sediminis]|uniref:group III truncated hemoglobin n=1 Tax=Stappia sediminis TaxID=2692190 RepID=UPI001926A9F9|nr:group III truncated hemoglobin [Stappia sediminis]
MIDIRPAPKREPAHPAIDAEGISRLVDAFYARVRADARLGPIFEARLKGRWPEHLKKMKLFWHSVLLKSGAYKGKPVESHRALENVLPEDYRQWLALFRPVAREIFEPEAARAVIDAAERIAESLWLASFGTPGVMTPDWMKTSGKEREIRHA